MVSMAVLKYKLWAGWKLRIRRPGDGLKSSLVDKTSTKVLEMAAGIFLLSFIDGIMTLVLTDQGAFETNPFLAYFLKRGPVEFMVFKLSLTTFGIYWLLYFSNSIFRPLNIRVEKIFPVIIIGFTLVVCWEFILGLYIVVS